MYLGNIEEDTKNTVYQYCNLKSSVIDYKSNTLTWIKSYEKYLELLGKDISVEWDKVSLIVVDKKTYDSIPYINAIICSNPKQAFYMIIEFFLLLSSK